MVERRTKHEYFQAPFDEIRKRAKERSWFSEYGRGVPSVVFVQEDIRFSRLLIFNMLRETWDRERFFLENGEMEPKPDEVDRMHLIAYLQAISSLTGLINGEEIREIQEKEGRVSTQDFLFKEGALIDFNNLKEMTDLWRAQGLKIGLFHGAFDPPTVVHLSCAAEAYTHCDRLIVGFDGDALLRSRKGETRPRFSLDQRREIFGSFWMVDGTFVLRADSVEDSAQYAQDYRDLNVGYVFLARQQQDKSARIKKIMAGGAEPKILVHTGFERSATNILKLIKERGW